MMFKAILAFLWHSLSDVAMEQALCVRINFLHFWYSETLIRNGAPAILKR
jgi:hypothetical protein